MKQVPGVWMVAAALWTATILYGIELCFRYGHDPYPALTMEIEALNKDTRFLEEEKAAILKQYEAETKLLEEALASFRVTKP